MERTATTTDLVECRPFLFQDVQADVAVVVHVRMEAGCGELDWGRLVGITWEGNVGSCWTHPSGQGCYLLGILVWVCIWDLRTRTPWDPPQFQSRRGDYLRQGRQKCPEKWEKWVWHLGRSTKLGLVLAPSGGMRGSEGPYFVWRHHQGHELSLQSFRNLLSCCSVRSEERF